MYTGLWTLGLRQRLEKGLADLDTRYLKKKLESWRKILVRTGQTLTLAARNLTGLRFHEDDEEPRHTAMTFKEKVVEARKDKLGRRNELARKRKKSLERKNSRLVKLGLVNKTPLNVDMADEHSQTFLDNLIEFLEEDCSYSEINCFPIGGVT